MTRDGTADSILRDEILRREEEQGKNIFPARLTASRIPDWQRYTVNQYHAISHDHAYSVCVCVTISFILGVGLVDAPAEVTQEEGHTRFLHLPYAALTLIFITRRTQPSLSLVDREVEFCVCRRRRRRIEIPRRVNENDDHYRGSVWGIWPDSVGEKDRDSLDAGAGETAEERGIAATTTCHRSSGAKVRSDRPVPILGGLVNEDGELTQEINHQSRAAWACIRRFSFRPAESTVETYGSTVESGGDGGPTIRMHDVGPPPRPLPVTEEDTPPAIPASYRVPPQARHLPTAFVRSGPQEDWVPKRGSYRSTTATSVRGSHGQTTRRAPPEAADGRKTSRGGRSRQGTPGAELDGLSQGRLPSVRSHRRLYDGQPAHIRS